MLRQILRSISKTDTFKQHISRQQQQPLFRIFTNAQAQLGDFQKRRIEAMIDVISEMSETEREILWQDYRDRLIEVTGIDVALKSDFFPKIEKKQNWPEINPESLGYFRDEGKQNLDPLYNVPGGLVDKILKGEKIDLIKGGIGVGTFTVQVEAEAPVEEIVEKSTFNVMLKGFTGESKVKLIKEVKDITKLGLKEAKEQVEASVANPVTLVKGIGKEEAEGIAEKLTALGGVIAIE